MFTHLDASDRPAMVDVSGKAPTRREATARALVLLPPEVSVHFRDGPPTPDAAIFLNHFTHWIGDDAFDPFRTYRGAIRPFSHCLEITCEFHVRIKSQMPMIPQSLSSHA